MAPLPNADHGDRVVVRLTVLPLLLGTTAAAIAFVAGLSLRLPPDGFALVPLTLAPAAAVMAAALLTIRARSEADPSLRWAAGGLVVAAVAMSLQLISFPALASGGGVFGVVRQGSLLYFVFHLALAGGIAAAAIPLSSRLLVPAVTAGVVVSLVLAQPALAPAHPVVMDSRGNFTSAAVVLDLVVAGLTVAVGVWWLWRSGRRPSATRGWLLAALALSTYDLVFNAIGHERFSRIWWSSVGLRASTFVVVAAGLVWVTSRQLAETEREVSAGLSSGTTADGEVRTWTDATNRLLATARLLSDATSVSGVANALTLIFRRILDLDGVAVLAVDAGDPGKVLPLGETGAGTDVDVVLSEEERSPGLAGRLLAHPASFCTGAGAVADIEPRLALAGLQTLAVVPLGTVDSTRCTLIVASRRRRAFTRLERELLTAVTRQGEQALRRAAAEEAQSAGAQALERINRDLRGHVDTLVGTSPDAIVTVDSAGVIVGANGHTSEMFGYPSSYLVGRPVEVLLPERLRSLHVRHRQGYLSAPVLRPMGAGLMLTARRSDGTEFPVEVSLAPTSLGDETLILATVRDMSDARAVEAQLREAVQRFTAAFEDAPVGMALVGLDGQFTQVNQALAVMLNYPRDELVGMTLAELTDPRDLEDDPQFDELLTDRITGYHREIRLLGRDGSAVWTQISTSLVRDSDGAPAYLVSHVEDLSDRKHFEGRLQFLADHDPLTGLFNRRRFDQELDRHLTEHARYGGAGAVLMLDLDNFKYVNDTLGHSVGDALIRVVAETMRRRLRDSDILARLGGDEFAVLLPTTTTEEAEQVARSLLEAVRTEGVLRQEPNRARTTVSIGIMPMTGAAAARTAEEVLAAADLAMYAAKEEGRDRAEVYDAEGPHVARVEARFRWLERIHEALENDGFTLVAQPILDLTTNRISQQELLLRMREGDQLIVPGLFLYIAERHGLARAIDRWVVHAAIAFAGQQVGPDLPRLELNLSAESLGDLELPAFIAAELGQHRVDPRRVVFEVTETAAITNMDVARHFVEQLADLGCDFALDDFGAGFGSFYYLRYLAFDYLKIDGEFIRHLPASPDDQVIVASIVSAAHGLGKKTIAEYVGDETTLDLLREIGVDYAQGYHIGRPQPLGAEPIVVPAPSPATGTSDRR